MPGKHSKPIFDIKLKPINFKKPKDIIGRIQKKSLPLVIVISVLTLSLVLSLCFVGGYFFSNNKQRKILSDSAELFRELGGQEAIVTLAAKNEDITGWINVVGTNICQAVCQGDNDTYYINRNQFGKKSRYGALFLSCTDSFEREGNDKNIVIFGNDKKDGSMFGSLKKYRNLNFYKQHPCIEIYYGDAKEYYVIFSVMLVSSHQDDEGQIYKPYKSFFDDAADFNLWLTETQERSIINSTIEVNHGDELLTLVTSANDFENARLVIHAKKITEWDASHMDVSGATISKKTKYPKIWYTTRGLEYPY